MTIEEKIALHSFVLFVCRYLSMSSVIDSHILKDISRTPTMYRFV